MKWPAASLFFLILSFIFFIIWLVSSFLLDAVYKAMMGVRGTLTASSNHSFTNILNNISVGFGIICVLFFVCGIVLFYVLESWSDEPEYYYRQ